MKISKRLVTIGMGAVLLAVSVIAPTFSWYNHNGSQSGNEMKYSRSALPVSTKTKNSSNIDYSTKKCDENGLVTDTNEVKRIYVTPNADTLGKTVQYYKTTFTNNGNTEVFVDFDASDLANSADYVIGTISPTINEKAFASRASRSKASGIKTRVYFRTNNDFKSFWGKYCDDGNNYLTTNMQNDFNIAYKTSGNASEVRAKLHICPFGYDGTQIVTVNNGVETVSHSESNPANSVFWFDLPSDTEYYYFFNHWYYKSSSNVEWNRTIDITDSTPGKLYFLTGASVDAKWKEYDVESSDDLLAINQSYTSVRMSNGTSVYADIGLKKVNEDDPEFVPEYLGTSIEYSVESASPSGVVSVNMDGLISPHGTGDAVITTTVKGKYGDSDYVTTAVSIPPYIEQVPIIHNVKVPVKGTTDESTGKEISNTVEIIWYAINRSTDINQIMTTGQDDTTPSLYYSI